MAGRQERAERRFRQRAARYAPDHVDVAEERRRRAIHGRIVDVVGRATLDDPPAAHQRDLVGHPHRLVRFVCDQDDGGALFLQDVEGGVADAVAQAVVEAGKRLVHQHHARTRGQRAGQRHPLLFAPRQLVRMLCRKTLKVDAGQQFLHPRRLCRLVAGQAKADVPGDGQMRKQRKVLKHQPDMARLGRDVHARSRHLRPVDPDLARIRRLDPGNHPQRGGLAAARRTQKTRHLPRRNPQIDRIDHCAAAKGARQSPDF